MSQKIVANRAVNSIISVFTQLHRSGFNSEFETLYESILEAVPDLWQRKGKEVVASKPALSLFSGNTEIKQLFEETTLASY